MDNKLFLMQDGKANEMQMREGYENEAYLQKIIRDNPNLLARSVEDGVFKKLFLIEQEVSVKETDDSSTAYSLDHLLVDEDGIPVLVEVKRSSDTRIKREVVAQMLDYASRASKWDIEQLKKAFEKNNADSYQFNDEFWEKVSTNLQAEHFRLVFAADEIPDTLRILIEFMDRTMKDIEVYGVELKPYMTNGTLLLASNVVGNSLLDSTKASSSGKRILKTRTVDEFRNEFITKNLEEVLAVFDELYDYILRLDLDWESGVGLHHPAYKAKIERDTLFRILLWKKGNGYKPFIEFDLDILCRLSGNDDKELIRSRLISFPSLQAEGQESLKKPASVQYIDFNILKQAENMDYFKGAVKALVDDIRLKDNI